MEAFLENGFDLKKILALFPRVNFLPFDSSRKFIASFHAARDQQGEVTRVFVSGAPEVILDLAADFPGKENARAEFESLAQKGFRVIAGAEEILQARPGDISG